MQANGFEQGKNILNEEYDSKISAGVYSSTDNLNNMGTGILLALRGFQYTAHLYITNSARIYIKMGYLLGVNGVITFKNAKIKEVIKDVGLENIILETDSPYLTPEPFRGKQNNPGHVFEIAKFIADLYNISLEELAKKTNKNIANMYKKMKLD